jgi:hypothetical protein
VARRSGSSRRVERGEGGSPPLAGSLDVGVYVHLSVGSENGLDRERPGGGPPWGRGRSRLPDTLRAIEPSSGELTKLPNGHAGERLAHDLAPMRQRLVRVAGRVLEIVGRDGQMMNRAERRRPFVLEREERVKATLAVSAIVIDGTALITSTSLAHIWTR